MHLIDIIRLVIFSGVGLMRNNGYLENYQYSVSVFKVFHVRMKLTDKGIQRLTRRVRKKFFHYIRHIMRI